VALVPSVLDEHVVRVVHFGEDEPKRWREEIQSIEAGSKD
jgi:hypothetical protein